MNHRQRRQSAARARKSFNQARRGWEDRVIAAFTKRGWSERDVRSHVKNIRNASEVAQSTIYAMRPSVYVKSILGEIVEALESNDNNDESSELDGDEIEVEDSENPK
jgi:hypothetical protein